MGFHDFGAGDVFTAAQADNLMLQSNIQCTSGTRPSAPAEGTRIYQTDLDLEAVWNGAAWVTLTPKGASVATLETSASTTYVALATAGPTISLLQTGAKAKVTISALMTCSVANRVYMGYSVSGATTIAAADVQGITYFVSIATLDTTLTFTDYITGLTPGQNTFTSLYRTATGTGTWSNRRMFVEPLP